MAVPRAGDDDREAAELAALLDPIALERRLAQARAQRAAALAARRAAAAEIPAAPEELPAPTAAPVPVTPLPTPPLAPPPLVAERRAPSQARRRLLPVGVLAGFAAGAAVALGAVVLLEPRLELTAATGTAARDPAPPPPAAVAEIVPAPPAAEAVAANAPLPVAPRATAAAPPMPAERPIAAARPAAQPAPLAPRSADAAPPMDEAALAPADMPAEMPAEMPADVPGAAGAAAFADLPLRLILHAPSGTARAEVDAALTALTEAVRAPEGPIPVRYAISRSNVRYYHREDAEAAAAAAAALSDGPGAVEARDFTSYQPRPARGTIEIWLSGTPGRGAARSSAAAAPTPTPNEAAATPGAPVRAQPLPPPPAGHDIPALVQRVIERQAIEAANEAARQLDTRPQGSLQRLDQAIGNSLRRAYGAP